MAGIRLGKKIKLVISWNTHFEPPAFVQNFLQCFSILDKFLTEIIFFIFFKMQTISWGRIAMLSCWGGVMPDQTSSLWSILWPRSELNICTCPSLNFWMHYEYIFQKVWTRRSSWQTGTMRSLNQKILQKLPQLLLSKEFGKA